MIDGGTTGSGRAYIDAKSIFAEGNGRTLVTLTKIIVEIPVVYLPNMKRHFLPLHRKALELLCFS
jgi:hypothetical protein